MPEFVAVFTPFFPQLIAQCLGFAIAGAASSLAQQSIAIGFGDQQQLSWSAVGQSALLSAGTAGIARGLGIDMMSKTPQYHGFVKSAIQNVELTIASQGLSLAIGQQRHFDWRVMVGSVVSTIANVGVNHLELVRPMYNEALATASSTITTLGVDKMLDGEMNTEDMVASALGTVIGNQLAAGAKQYYTDYQINKKMEAEARRSQIPEIGQTLEQSKRQFIDSVLEHPHDHGGAMKKDYSSSSTKTPSTHQTKTRNKSEPPPQPHLAKERAREEGQMCYAFDWNQENNSTPTQQRVSQTQGGFWSTAGDAASSLIDMVNPVTQAKTTWADANESVRAFRNGEILHGLASTAHTALDVLYFVPVGSVASSGVRLGAKGVSAVGSKLGFFGGKGAAKTEQELTKSYVRGNIATAREASGYVTFSRRATARSFYAKGGWSSERIESHMNGIDFSTNVTVDVLPKGIQRKQLQIPNTPIGNYFTLLEADTSKLGIYTSGRVTEIYEATRDISILQSKTATTIDYWSMMKYQWEIEVRGGEIQNFTHNTLDWKLIK